jgi:hypothetical protein
LNIVELIKLTIYPLKVPRNSPAFFEEVK